MATATKRPKKQKIRNNEYYDTQALFDDLYAKSQRKHIFKDLMQYITSRENILLAYRNIKKNKGSKTRGVNRSTILSVAEKDPEALISYVRNRLNWFTPHPVRRVEIPKPDGKMRPLGIPTIEDRLIQQCILQVLEPVCEAKFYAHSYGFRPNRGTRDAIARANFLTSRNNFQYVVDIDIKGFFDNVNHAKLLKQIWTLGIRDKNLLCIISKMLKAEIAGEGVPTKGVPQGGLLSPLLSNIVLNELDWWIASQWETFQLKRHYSSHPYEYKVLRETSQLKEVFIVRYADDFKLFCKKRSDADKLFQAVQMWLKERLGLEINQEKSKVVNLKKHYSEFLGIKMKLWHKGKKWVIKSHMRDKAVEKARSTLKDKVKKLQKYPTPKSVNAFNATVLGLHNYFNMATNVYLDFDRIAFEVNKSLKCRLKHVLSKNIIKTKTYQKFYGNYTGKLFAVQGRVLFPIASVKNCPPKNFSQETCSYTPEGRKKIHSFLQAVDMKILHSLMENPVGNTSAEYNDNRISLYVGQQGRCYVTGEPLRTGEMEVHHKKRRRDGGGDLYANLVWMTADVHKLIHATDNATIEFYLKRLYGTKIDFLRLNQLRKLVGNCDIDSNK